MPSSAPCCLAKASFSGDEAQAITRAPMILPISMAAKPVPPDAPSTASVSPAFSLGAILQRIERGAIGDAQPGGAVEIEAVRNLVSLSAATAIFSRAAP